MHRASRLVCSALLLWCAGSVCAQTAAPVGAPVATPAVEPPLGPTTLLADPMLTKPVDQLTPEQVAAMQKRLADWANLQAFHDDDAKLPPTAPGRVVFMGDSITIGWSHSNFFFPGKPYVNRGISGQTTPQMVLRFQQDVVALKPAAVVILAGINDIAGNTGPMTLQMTENNLASMVAMAQQNGIRVVLSSVLPSTHIPWRNNANPSERIRELNAWLQKYATAHGCTWLDYYSSMVDAQGGMKPGLSREGLHPLPAGYAVMEPLAQAAIDRAMQAGPPR